MMKKVVVKRVSVALHSQTRNSSSKEKYLEYLRKKLKNRENREKKICLVMIVKNESKNMVRVLSSLKNIIDTVSIVDTGSTDNTENVIAEWCKNEKKPYLIHHEPFKNFGYNRTHSFEMAKKSFPDSDYFLLSDADFIWEDYGFKKSDLIHPCYSVLQYNQSIEYWNIRIISSKYQWVCYGVTHEYWHTNDISFQQEKLNTLKICDMEDGGCKDNKFERDERLLKEAISSNPPKRLLGRYYFYLAQTLRDLRRYEESIEYYRKRIDCGGWQEEIFYSLYQIGRCYEFLQDYTRAREYYLKAFRMRKTRIEPLYYLLSMLVRQGKIEEAKRVYEIGKNISYPDNDFLFIEKNCYLQFNLLGGMLTNFVKK